MVRRKARPATRPWRCSRSFFYSNGTRSDPAAEEAVRDRLSFRRFCGIPLDRETPDHSSIWRFRQTLDSLGLSAALLAEVNRQLEARGLIVKRGTLVDATLIEASVRRPYEGGGVNPRDPDARFSRKRDKTYFGYKAHLAVDEESGLVRQIQMTSANVHDGRLGERLIQGDEQGFFADKAYDSQALRETLARRGLVDGIAWKSSITAIRSRPGSSFSTPGRPAF